jgi:hypothetical protein
MYTFAADPLRVLPHAVVPMRGATQLFAAGSDNVVLLPGVRRVQATGVNPLYAEATVTLALYGEGGVLLDDLPMEPVDGVPGTYAWVSEDAIPTGVRRIEATITEGDIAVVVTALAGVAPFFGHPTPLAALPLPVGPQGPPGAPGGGEGGGVAAAWHAGAGVPASGLGANGDYYLRTSNGDVYAKASGAWSVVGNIRGPQGIQGIQGIQGPPGEPGADGADGDDGAPGTDGADGAPGVVAATAPITYDAPTQTVGISAATPGAAGSMSAADKAKLDGVATGATANATNADLRDRTTHTGTQAAGTITGLATVATSGSASDLTTGTLPVARIADDSLPVAKLDTSGTPDGTKFLRDDGAWAAAAGGGSSPLTTKGDLYTRDGSADARIAVGPDWTLLMALASATTGQQYAHALRALGVQPYVATELYDGSIIAGNNNSASVSAGVIYYSPWIVFEAKAFDRIGFATGSAVAGNGKAALYAPHATTLRPDAFLFGSASLSTNAANVAQLDTISQTLAPGLYWAAAWFDAAASVRIYGAGRSLSFGVVNGSFSGTGMGYTQTLAFGAFPSTATPARTNSIGLPCVFLRSA